MSPLNFSILDFKYSAIDIALIGCERLRGFLLLHRKKFQSY